MKASMEYPRVVTGNFTLSFSLNFLCISQAPLGQSLWSGYYWKDLFLLQQLSIDDANFDQNWWLSEVEERLRLVTGGYGRHRRQRVNVKIKELFTELRIYLSPLNIKWYFSHRLWIYFRCNCSFSSGDTSVLSCLGQPCLPTWASWCNIPLICAVCFEDTWWFWCHFFLFPPEDLST